MKNKIQNSVRVLIILFAASFSVNAKAPFLPGPTGNSVATHLNISMTIPDALQSQIVRQDFENESIFSLKNGNNPPVFLFSVTKVTGHQWMQIKDQVKDYTILENKDELITFVQRTDMRKINAATNNQFQILMPQVDGMIAGLSHN
jgi:hypothetical protein